jgi:AcrR family transcriptional regulator
MWNEPKIERRRRRPGRRPQEEGNAEDTRKEILAKSLSLFNTRGYTAVSIDDIAAAAGITKPTFYYHFPSKAEVFIESILWLLTEVRGFIERLAGQTDLTVYERLRGMIQGRRERLTREPIIVFNESRMEEAKMHLTGEQSGRIHKAVQGFHQPLSRMMAEGIASGELRPDADPNILAVLLRQMLQPTTYHSLSDKDPVEVDAAVLELFYRGAMRRNTEEISSLPLPGTHPSLSGEGFGIPTVGEQVENENK